MAKPTDTAHSSPGAPACLTKMSCGRLRSEAMCSRTRWPERPIALPSCVPACLRLRGRVPLTLHGLSMSSRRLYIRVTRPRLTRSLCRCSSRSRTGWQGQAPSSSAEALARIWPINSSAIFRRPDVVAKSSTRSTHCVSASGSTCPSGPVPGSRSNGVRSMYAFWASRTCASVGCSPSGSVVSPCSLSSSASSSETRHATSMTLTKNSGSAASASCSVPGAGSNPRTGRNCHSSCAISARRCGSACWLRYPNSAPDR